jgi:hypothetical protein
LKLDPTVSYDWNYPLQPTESQIKNIACLVKTYDNFNDFKLNSCVEFVGILSQDASLAYVHDEHNMHAGDEEQMHVESSNEAVSQSSKLENSSITSHMVRSSYPPSKVPRLHSIFCIHLNNNNPLLNIHEHYCEQIMTTGIGLVQYCSRSFFILLDLLFVSFLLPTTLDNSTQEQFDNEKCFKKAKSQDYWNKQYENFLLSLNKHECIAYELLSAAEKEAFLDSSHQNLIKLRQELIGFFQELLLGDALAAEYLLMHLISNV